MALSLLVTPGAGPLFGGKQGDQSDDAANIAGSQHVFGVTVAASDVTGLDTGFSFDLVSTSLNGTSGVGADDDDPANGRTAQGSLRQFIQNANVLGGPDQMRFVPAHAPNQTGGGGNWWQLTLTGDLPTITDAATTIDGTAYSLLDGTTVRDDNPSQVGTGGPVGTQGFTLPLFERPELELVGTAGLLAPGLHVQSDDSAVSDLAMHGFVNGDIHIGPTGSTPAVANVTVERNLLGVPAEGAVDPPLRSSSGVSGRYADDVVVTNNYIGRHSGGGVSLEREADRWNINNNEIRDNALGSAFSDGIGANRESNDGTIERNLITGVGGQGIDLLRSAIGWTVNNNTVTNSGTLGGVERAGIALYGSPGTVQYNVITGNLGHGVIVEGQQAGYVGTPANGYRISQNEFGNNGGTAIDLLTETADRQAGDGLTANDGADGCGRNPLQGNQGLDHPVLTRAELVAATVEIDGTTCALAEVEIYIAAAGSGDNDGQDRGEGVTYLGTVVADGAGILSGSVPAGGTVAGQSVTAIAIDGGTQDTSEFSPNLVVTVLDNPPVVTDPGLQAAREGELFSLTISAVDPEGDTPITYALVSAPVGMTIDPNSGLVEWTPDETTGGTNVVAQVAATANGLTGPTVPITIAVDETNQAPVVTAPPPGSVQEGFFFTASGSVTDADIPANTLTWSLGPGAPPWVTINPTTGGLSGQAANPGVYNIDLLVTDDGVDGITPDPLQGMATWTLTVTVAPPPVITFPPGPYVVDELTELLLSFSATNGPITWSIQTGPPGSQINSGGVFRWTPTETQGPGSAPLILRATGPGGLSSDFGATITINEVNTAPVVDPVTPVLGDTVTPLATTATATDLDFPANTLSWSLTGAPAGMTISATGDITWPTPVAGSYAITVTATDDGTPALAGSVVWNLTIDPGPPTIVAPALPYTVDEGATLLLDFDANDTTSWSVSGLPGATIDANGVLSWPTSEGDGPAASVAFTVGASGPGGADTFNATVEVFEINQAPTVTSPPPVLTVQSTAPIAVPSSATDPDLPVNNLGWSLSGAPAWLSINPTTGQITGTAGPVGSYSFNLVVTDDGATRGAADPLSDSVLFDLTVVPFVPPAPVITAPPGPYAVDELSLLQLPFTASNTTGWNLVSGPSGLTINPVTGELTWTPTEAQGPDPAAAFTIEATGPGGTTPFAGTVQVNEINEPPVVDPITPVAITSGVPFSTTATASDPDLPVNAFTWSLLGEPAGMSIDPGTGLISWPNPVVGNYSITVTTTDNGPGTLSGSSTWNLAVDPPAPVITVPAGLTAAEFIPFTTTITADQPVTWSIDSGPGVIDPASGVITWTPQELNGGTTALITVRATATSGAASTAPVSIVVAEVNAGPSIANIPTLNRLLGQSVIRTAVAIDTDIPNNQLTWSLVSGPPGATIDPASGEFFWTSTGVGTFPVTIRVDDDGAPQLFDTEFFNVVVTTVPVGTTTTSPVSPTTAPPTTTPPTSATTTSSPATTTTVTPSTSPPSTVPSSIPPDREEVGPPPIEFEIPPPVAPELDSPLGPGGRQDPQITLTGSIASLTGALQSLRIPPLALALAGAWLWVLAIPLVAAERRLGVHAAAGAKKDESVALFATRTSPYPFAHLRADEPLLWSRARFFSFRHRQRIRVETPVGDGWVERDSVIPTEASIKNRMKISDDRLGSTPGG